MNTPCSFNPALLSFSGPPLDQARCLLRFVKRGGNVDDTSATLPSILQQLLAAPQALNLTVAQLRAYLGLQGIPENMVGGSLDDPVSHADSNNAAARLAQYFVIHDTSSKLSAGQTFDPNFINSARWSGNRLSGLGRGLTHIYVTRLGETLTDRDYHTPWRATRFENTLPNALLRGLFLHHELIQPRMGPGESDIDSPDPGFTQVQYERLALQYLIASVRRGSWMIPGFHCVIDLQVGDHDDPQHFDLSAWGTAISNMLDAVRGPGTVAPPPPLARLRSGMLAGDPILQEVAAGNRVLGPSQVRMPVGVGPLQDGLNLLADHGEAGLRIAGALPDGGSRGFYGVQTLSAVRLFQTLHHVLPVDGSAGKDTIIALDAALLTLEQGDDDGIIDGDLGTPVGHFTTPATSSTTANGSGGSTTSGLDGPIFHTDDGSEVIDATETVTAKREGHSLGAVRSVRQIRTKRGGITTVHQPDYCWGTRTLPDAELTENHPGFGGSASVLSGRATFFGKSDDVDEGTGTPAYGTVQTNSSVFGISLKRALLLSEGLAAQDSNHSLQPTEKGLQAKVEVFFPATRRMVSLPLVDVGPAPRINAIADLTVAASVFLQKLTEDEVEKPNAGNIDNIEVQARIVA
jgi:hypothetical protein